MSLLEKIRCSWCSSDPLYQDYHDKEWGRVEKRDQRLFEMLILEGAQAGLSWITVLKKRQHYRKVFYDFKVSNVAMMKDNELELLLKDPGIIRNRLKVYGTRKNALAFIEVQKEFGTFSQYLWSFVNDEPIINQYKFHNEIPAKTALSDEIAKDLKKRNFTFIGSTIIYAYLQATGVVNDHQLDCFCYEACVNQNNC
jgi:DNA-3-methyladenine glycosylase I